MDSNSIIDIPPKMEQYYGKGKMLHPSVRLISAMINLVPFGSITNIQKLGLRLSKEMNVDVTCPYRIGSCIKQLALLYPDPYKSDIPYWRVIKTDGYIIKGSNYESCASKLEDEGFVLKYKAPNNIKVVIESVGLFDLYKS